MMIHRYWEGDPPSVDRAEALQAMNPGVKVVTWTPETIPGWVTDLITGTAPAVLPEFQLTHAANVVRAAMLWTHGGWWVDHDLELHVPLKEVAFPSTGSHGHTRCNCWLAFPPGHIASRNVLENIALQAQNPPSPPRYAVAVSGERLWDMYTPEDVPALVLDGSWATHEGWTSKARQLGVRNGRSHV